MDVKAQVVEGQLGRLFLQLPGESDLPAAGNTHAQRVISSLQSNILDKPESIRIYQLILQCLLSVQLKVFAGKHMHEGTEKSQWC